MLCKESEVKNHIYWPVDRGQTLKFDVISLSLQTAKQSQWCTERIINLTHNEVSICNFTLLKKEVRLKYFGDILVS